MIKHGEPAPPPLAGFQTIEDVLAGLRERGGRVTPARRLLLSALFGDHQHRTAEELAGQVQAQAPDVNISTIYRNLDELVRLGVVDRSHLGSGPAAYHLTSATHGHLFCQQCGTMTEAPAELFRGVARTLAARYGFAAQPHRFSVTGRCADCQRHDTGQLPGACLRSSERGPRMGYWPHGLDAYLHLCPESGGCVACVQEPSGGRPKAEGCSQRAIAVTARALRGPGVISS